MTENKEQAPKTRYRMLDLIRGVTVFLMVAAHAVYFFHNDTSETLSFVERFGNTIAFSTFIIVSGATATIAYFSRLDIWPERRRRLLKRITVLLAGYFAIAFVVYFASLLSTHGIPKLQLIFDILTFRKLPSFAEFYIPFMVFPVIVSLFPKIFKKITESLFLTLLSGLVIYFSGMLLFRISMPDFLVPWKALFVGSEGFYRFPIFQYFPLYLLGLAWGAKLLTLKVKKQVELAEGVMLTAGLGLAISIITFSILGDSLEEILKRWPPSIPFLLAGIFFASILALFFYSTKQLAKTRLLKNSVLVLGQNALGLALTHIFLLQIYTLAGGARGGSITLYIVSFIILLLLSIALAAIIPFNFRFALSLERGYYHEKELEEETIIRLEEEISEDFEEDVSKVKKYFFLGNKSHNKNNKLVKKRHILGASILLSLAALVVFPPIAEEYQAKKDDNADVLWYDSQYSYRTKLTIKNEESVTEIPKGKTIEFALNHLGLVASKKSYPDGKDLLVLEWDGREYRTVEHAITTSPNQSATMIAIELLERVKPGATLDKYYLYYGNNLAEAKTTETLEAAQKTKYTITPGSEEAYPQLLSLDRRWSLINNDPKNVQTIRITLQTAEDYQTTEAKYVVEGISFEGRLEKTAEKQWEGVIDTQSLEPGTYRVKAKINNGSEDLASSQTGFFVSYPLYVAWTQDWEGYDVPDVYLAAITQVARDHGLVMTHFWNPRLTMTETVSDGRKEKLTDWVKTRESVFGESVQLHLHMFSDFVLASGVTPKNTPNWGDSGDGYGSLTTNYAAEELTKIITKGMDIMKADGFSPTIYRAGGWFADSATLLAVQNSGLLADSSGRTAYKFYSQKGPWDLAPTTLPYYPNINNQNKSDSPSLSILEIPNNGADSYWFSSEEMRKRFYDNYQGGILTEPKQITYLSHPHWFNKAEQGKIESVFSLIDSYKYQNDSGPAVYVTLDEIYQVWKR